VKPGGSATNGHAKDEDVKMTDASPNAESTGGDTGTPMKEEASSASPAKKRAASRASEEQGEDEAEDAPPTKRQRTKVKKQPPPTQDVETDEDDEPLPPKKRSKSANSSPPKGKTAAQPTAEDEAANNSEPDSIAEDEADADESEGEKPAVSAKAREKLQSTLKAATKDPYPDWKAGDPVPYAALCTTFSTIEMTTKRLEILALCSAFLRQVARLTPEDLLPTVLLMIGKLAADYAGIELGIGESLIMKAIGETTGRKQQVIKEDQQKIGDLGLVAAKSRSNQPTMFKPKPLTVRGVHEGLMKIATVERQGRSIRVQVHHSGA
jgi:DNA ligase 1